MTGKRVQSFVIRDGTILEMTEREHQVLTYLVAGVNHEQLRGALRISERTVNIYNDRFRTMAGAHNKNQLAVWAVVTGLVRVKDIWELWQQFNPELAAWKVKDDTPTI